MGSSSSRPFWVPPSTLPPGWISQFDLKTSKLYYIFPHTNLVQWTHPRGQVYHEKELARFYEIEQNAHKANQNPQKPHKINSSSGSSGRNSRQNFITTYNAKGGFRPRGSPHLFTKGMILGGVSSSAYNDTSVAGYDYGGSTDAGGWSNDGGWGDSSGGGCNDSGGWTDSGGGCSGGDSGGGGGDSGGGGGGGGD